MMLKQPIIRVAMMLAALIILVANTAQAQTILRNNDQGAPVYTETGNWFTGGVPGYNGGTYRFASAAMPRTATWNATLPHSGKWRVEVIYLAGTNRATNAVYQIQSSNQSHSASINQQINSMQWVSLGTFQLDYGSASITLNANASTPSGSVVMADAVRFVAVNDPAEMRIAVITVFDPLTTTASIQNQVDTIASLNYNAIAVHARYRGDATYFPNKTNSTYPNNEPRTSAAGSIDVIQEFTTRGHAAGLKVFAYVNAFLVTDGQNTDWRQNHIINQHPNWITYYYNNGNPIVQTTAHESEGRWIDPAIPAAREYVANICADIIANYNVDGIMLDRIRYPQTAFTRPNKDFGYHPTAIAAFNAQYGKSGIPNPNDSDWIAFRQQQITQAVEKIYFQVTNEDPNAIVLSYPLGRFNDALNFNYQHWPNWLSYGVIDGALPQIYTTNNTTFNSWATTHRNAYTGPRLLGVTTQAYLSGINVAGQINITRNLGFDGTSPYRHGSMGALGYYSHLQSTYNSRAPWPAMPWKSQGGPTTVIRDNDSGPPTYIESGTWSLSGTPGYNGGTYKWASAATNSFATWDLDVPSTGKWAVQVIYLAGSNRTTSTRYRIHGANGVSTVNINQRQNSMTWVTLGTFDFVKGRGTVTLDASTSSGGSVVIADAIRIVKQ